MTVTTKTTVHSNDTFTDNDSHTHINIKLSGPAKAPGPSSRRLAALAPAAPKRCLRQPWPTCATAPSTQTTKLANERSDCVLYIHGNSWVPQLPPLYYHPQRFPLKQASWGLFKANEGGNLIEGGGGVYRGGQLGNP